MIQPSDLMDAAEVCERFGCAKSSLRVAMTKPEANPKLAGLLPPPLRKIGGQWVWRRADIEAVDYSARTLSETRVGPMSLYRFYDANGRLLYVGISVAMAQRTASHRAKSWWPEVDRIDVKSLGTTDRDEAAKIERQAIRDENPLYNVSRFAP